MKMNSRPGPSMGAYASNFNLNKAVAVLPPSRTLVNFLQVPLHDHPLKPNCSCCYFRDKKLQQAAEHNKAGFAVHWQYVVTTNGFVHLQLVHVVLGDRRQRRRRRSTPSERKLTEPRESYSVVDYHWRCCGLFVAGSKIIMVSVISRSDLITSSRSLSLRLPAAVAMANCTPCDVICFPTRQHATALGHKSKR